MTTAPDDPNPRATSGNGGEKGSYDRPMVGGRVWPAEYELIAAAAAKIGTKVSPFVAQAALKEARAVLSGWRRRACLAAIVLLVAYAIISILGDLELIRVNQHLEAFWRGTAR